MSSTTSNYSLIKPGVNDPTDQDLWGGYLNDDLDSIDSLIKTATNWLKNEQTTNYSLLATDINKQILCDATSAPFNITLLSPATAGDGYAILIKKTDASANAVTVIGTIDGAASFVLSSKNDYVFLISDGASGYSVYSKTASDIEFATSAEVKAGIISDKAIAPDTLGSAGGFVKGWCRCTSTGAITKAYGIVTGVSKVGTGTYNISFSAPLATSNYMVLPWGDSCVVQLSAYTTSGFNLQTYASPGFGLTDKNFSFIVMDN